MFLLAFLPILIIIGIIAYLVYMGAFLPITIEEKQMGPFHFLYKEINGKDYSLIGKTTTEITNILKQYNFSNQKPLQVFYPDTENKVEVGFLVDEKVNDLKELKSKTIPQCQCLITSFPWRNSLSFILGFSKVDPVLNNHRKSNNYKKTEVMVMLESDSIVYIQRIESSNYEK